MKSNQSRILVLLASLVVLFLLVYSCKKDPYKVGINLLPPSDTLNVSTSDTASFIAHSSLQDSLRTDKTSTNILGSLMDPVFGSTTASWYMQYWLSAEAPDFGKNPVLDSVVLMIPYGKIYGDSNSIQTLNVYELSQDIHYDSAYYSNQSARTYGIRLANYSFKPAPHDSLTIGGAKKPNIPPHIRINLSKNTNYFGKKLLSGQAYMVVNTSFLSFMKGLYIESERVPFGGALLSFDPTSTLSNIVLYYRNPPDTAKHQYIFVGSPYSGRFNHIDHNHYVSSTNDFKQQVLQHDTVLGRDKLYIQGLGGVRVQLRMPFLKNFAKTGKIAINSAVLTVTNAETDTTLQPPVKLTLVVVDSVGHIGFLPDESEGSAYFGGSYNTSARTYKFRITRHLQQILDGTVKNYDFYLLANDPTVNVLVPNRVILAGTKPQLPGLSGDHMRLEVIYTRLH